ncbi:hypothetical protein JZO70_15640 [Enterococcus sp. 669A]|uniref:Uncharacterized protein n=1 Tax=Candidatus Enterococcus moelleringii TaxID=2815325 RepID=A0ABS3LF06_9ENTE|nr:hypothetical protein [Enterococcus sp. 669A]MBO1307608.1 hypothetical protein [Enterococcus sp. 669A]
MTTTSQKTIEDFMRALVAVSQTNPTVEQLKAIEEQFELEDLDKILGLLGKVNKSKLKRSDNQKVTKKTFPPTKVEGKKYSYEEVEKIFKNQKKEEILDNFTKRELTDMYISLFNFRPLSNSNKLDIFYGIQAKFDAARRGEAMRRTFFS